MKRCKICSHDEKEHDYCGAAPRGKCTGIVIDHVRHKCQADCKGFV